MNPTHIQMLSALFFALAIVHTFSTSIFENIAHKSVHHARLWHLLGEVEIVFGFWAFILLLTMLLSDGAAVTLDYMDSRSFAEPMFVFAVMVIAATRPILQTALAIVYGFAQSLPLKGSIGLYVIVLTVLPLLGSFITEPAAMTLAALILSQAFLSRNISSKLKYATLGVLFVNISIGGTLTPFAAPPVLMVASKWQWGIHFMMQHFGWKAALAVTINAMGAALIFRKELTQLPLASLTPSEPEFSSQPPLSLVLVHILFLAGVVIFAHHPAIFMGLFIFFLGITHAYDSYQNRLILREALLVAFFLAGLVVLGGQQQWWLQALLLNMKSDAVFWGALGLTALTDNAAITYLGSLVEGLSDTFKYALVAGAVTGGGLTVIANAPNPAGLSILRHYFDDQSVRPLNLLLAAALPTLVAIAAFKYL